MTNVTKMPNWYRSRLFVNDARSHWLFIFFGISFLALFYMTNSFRIELKFWKKHYSFHLSYLIYFNLVQNCLKSFSDNQNVFNKNVSMNQRFFGDEEYKSEMKKMFDDEPEVFGQTKSVPSIFTINAFNLTKQDINVENCECDELQHQFRTGIQIYLLVKFLSLLLIYRFDHPNTDKIILKSVKGVISRQTSSNWNLFFIKLNIHQWIWIVKIVIWLL